MNVAARRVKARYGKRDSDRNGENAGSDLCKVYWVNQQNKTEISCEIFFLPQDEPGFDHTFLGRTWRPLLAEVRATLPESALLHLLRPRTVLQKVTFSYVT